MNKAHQDAVCWCERSSVALPGYDSESGSQSIIRASIDTTSNDRSSDRRAIWQDVQGDHLLELPTDFKVPATWVKVCSTKKVHRWRPPEVSEAVREKERAAERLHVR
jgi:hypothetical protein